MIFVSIFKQAPNSKDNSINFYLYPVANNEIISKLLTLSNSRAVGTYGWVLS